MDRNIQRAIVEGNPNVALRKESVDRNPMISETVWLIIVSLSARRAWIEIILCCDSIDEH